jgi:hypothetical protein
MVHDVRGENPELSPDRGGFRPECGFMPPEACLELVEASTLFVPRIVEDPLIALARPFIVGLLLAASAVMAQDPLEGHAPGERFFHKAGIAVRLIGPDSLLITVGAGSEDLQNTVRVFPYSEENDGDTAAFRLLERRVESYLQDRIPVHLDGKRIYFKVTQWKPGGKDRNDRLDMKSLFVDNLFITMGAKIPPKRTNLDIVANLWIEREDASETEVQFSLFEGKQVLRREWTKRERKVRFPVSADSLKAMRKNPPPPLKRAPEENVEHDDHSGHNH